MKRFKLKILNLVVVVFSSYFVHMEPDDRFASDWASQELSNILITIWNTVSRTLRDNYLWLLIDIFDSVKRNYA